MKSRAVQISIHDLELEGTLELPDHPAGVVLFAHGSGSSRHSPRNRFVARTINHVGVGTFLFDLLSKEEERAEAATGHLRFNIDMLAERLIAATRQIQDDPEVPELAFGYFGSSTGAAAALMAAAELKDAVGAVVSRGGRPDLAGELLDEVTAPTLLIVGGEDRAVIPLNEDAYGRLRCEKALRIIPGATHLFEEAGALEKVADMAAEWFADRLAPVARRH